LSDGNRFLIVMFQWESGLGSSSRSMKAAGMRTGERFGTFG
jgi:hypothetical protein